MPLLNRDALEQSSVVANSAMNRERGCAGGNSYAKELGVNPIEILMPRFKSHERLAWLDLCCGTGKALVEAAQVFFSTEGGAD
jgi:hypothetical protein